jgi:CspA family cold shock protein
MGNYRGHRERRGRRNEDEGDFLPERSSEPNYFQRPASVQAQQPVDAEVVWFNEGKGFGFVKLPDGAEAYLNIRALEAVGRSGVSERTPLKVIVEESHRGRQVAQVLEIGEAPAGVSSRARPPVSESRGAEIPGETRGTVKWYNPDKGFGFIAPSDGDNDVFVHATTLGRAGIAALTEGQEVLIQCGQGKKGLEVRSLRLA